MNRFEIVTSVLSQEKRDGRENLNVMTESHQELMNLRVLFWHKSKMLDVQKLLDVICF